MAFLSTNQFFKKYGKKGITKDYLYKRVKNGTVPGIYFGHTFKIDEDAFLELLHSESIKHLKDAE